MKWLYLVLNLGSVAIPLLYSFNREMRFIKYWKSFLVSTSLVALFFLIWDAIFTHLGIWGFNPKYFLGFTILKMPFEEWLFFFCIPFASIFIHYSLEHFKPKLLLNKHVVKLIIVSVFVLSLFLVILNFEKAYTFLNFSVLSVAIVLAWIYGQKLLQRFLIAFLIILVPFIIVNGILTGSFIAEPVVWYNNEENLGIRLFTIPIEDIGYAFSLLFFNVLLFEKIKIYKYGRN